jgi:hypothetical protein
MWHADVKRCAIESRGREKMAMLLFFVSKRKITMVLAFLFASGQKKAAGYFAESPWKWHAAEDIERKPFLATLSSFVAEKITTGCQARLVFSWFIFQG